jgi:hypothetical protein
MFSVLLDNVKVFSKTVTLIYTPVALPHQQLALPDFANLMNVSSI